MKSLYKRLAERCQIKKKYFLRYLDYAKEIKKRAQELLGEANVLIFGSVVKGEYAPDSDIDILVISANAPEDLFESNRIKIELTKGFTPGVFEIHFVKPEDYKNWYKNFIKDDFVEVP